MRTEAIAAHTASAARCGVSAEYSVMDTPTREQDKLVYRTVDFMDQPTHWGL